MRRLKGNCNARAYKDILYKGVLLTLWGKKFEEEDILGMTVRGVQIFGHIV